MAGGHVATARSAFHGYRSIRVRIIGEALASIDEPLAQRAPELGVMIEVVPTAIPQLKQALAGARHEPMRRAMEGILALSDARSVAAALRAAQFAR